MGTERPDWRTPTAATLAEYGARAGKDFGFDPEVCKGVFVGGCVERGVGSSFRRVAHAHNHRKDSHYGWICVRSHRRLRTPAGHVSTLMLHEYAHLLCPNQGHTERWRRTISGMGRPAEAQRRRRRRPQDFS